MKCSIRVNEERDCRSDENIHALFALTAMCCCDTAVTSLYLCFTSSAGCLLRSWTRSCPTWTPQPFSLSVLPTSSFIGSPTRSECLAVKVNISALPGRNCHFLPLSLQRSVGKDLHVRVPKGPKHKAEEHWWAKAATAAVGSANSLSSGAGPAAGLLEDGLLQIRGCTWFKQVEKASTNNQQLHWTAQSNRARPTVGKRPLAFYMYTSYII